MNTIDAHKYSGHHGQDLLASEKAGCFHCERIFPVGDIQQWTDSKKTALCPHCGIDAVLPDIRVDISPEFLAKMNDDWFKKKADVHK